MCCRLVVDINEKEKKDLLKAINATETQQLSFTPSFNVTPGSFLPVIYKNNVIVMDSMKWGYIPLWSKNNKAFANTRFEEADIKNTWKNAFNGKRCLIPASGYYEWKAKEGKRLPYYIHSSKNKIITLAGLVLKDNDGKNRFTILTMKAISSLTDIHPRMPVIISPKLWELWLANNTLSESEQDQIQQGAIYEALGLSSYRVSSDVNSGINDRSNLITRLD